MKRWLWIFVALVVLIPLGVLYFDPASYSNPIVAFLLSLAVAGVSIAISKLEFLSEAKRHTQTEWLSQAESACDRLLTTCAHILRMKQRMRCTCQDAVHNLPELQDDGMRAVRTLFQGNCNSTADQLKDIADHLESAVSDWQRFIRKNCEGKECDQITQSLGRRKAELWSHASLAGDQLNGPIRSECTEGPTRGVEET